MSSYFYGKDIEWNKLKVGGSFARQELKETAS